MLPPRASLPGLPQELQDVIVQLVAKSSKQHVQDLVNLSYTCKALLATCLPTIYSNINLYSHLSYHQHARFLARTLSSSPAPPGKYTKQLTLAGLIFTDKLPEAILVHTPHLTSLACHFAAYQGDYGDAAHFDTISLEIALRNVSSTLTSLEISTSPLGFWDVLLTPLVPHNELDVCHLVALKYLCMSVSLLLGGTASLAPDISSVLPPNLRHLSIEHDPTLVEENYTWTSNLVLEKFTEFVRDESWRTYTPSLEKVTVHDAVWADWMDDVHGMGEPARRLCAAPGLVFEGSRKGLMEADVSDC